MKKYLPFLFFFSTLAAAQFFYGSGEAVNLENRIKYKNRVTTETGSVTPTSGLNRSTGSAYQKTDGTFWTKQYGNTTQWARVATASELSAYATTATLSNYVSKVDTATQTIVSKFVVNPTTGDILDLQTASTSVFKVETDGDFFFTTDVYNGKRGVSTNLFSGTSAGAGITTGLANTCHGYECLQTLTTGQRNTAIGYRAGKTSTLSSSDNTSLGAAALGTSTSGVRNTAVGSLAAQLNKAGSNNICLGYNCLPLNQNGSRNTAIGTDTGALSTNSDNIYLGYGAGSLNTASNKLYIATGTTLNLLYGDTALGQLGIATASLHSTSAFEVNSTSGVLYPPRMSTTQRGAVSALAGGILYDTTAARFYGHDGSSYDYFVESADIANFVSKTDTATQTMAGALALGAVQATASSGIVIRNSSGATVATFGNSGTGATFSNSLVVQGQTTLATSLTGPLKATAGVVATGTIALNSSTEVSGVLGWANGGTATSSFTNGHVIVASGSVLQGVAGSSNADVLAWNGSAWVASGSAYSRSQSYSFYQANNSLTDRLIELEFALGSVNVIRTSGSGIFTVEDDSANTRTKWIAQKKCVCTMNASARPTTANRPIQIRYNGGGQGIGVGSQNTASDPSHVSATVILDATDYLTIFVGTYDGTSGDSVPNDGSYVYTSITCTEVK